METACPLSSDVIVVAPFSPITTGDVMDDADVAGLAMGWMSKGD